MRDIKFNICLCSPIGNRKGTLYISPDFGAANSFFEVMGHKNPISDLVLSEGNISFFGELESLIGKTKYAATGTLCGNKILMNLKSESDTYSVFGEEVPIDEEDF